MRTFGVAKFRSLLVAGSFTVLANYVVGLSHSIIAGHMLGDAALAGVNLVNPCLSAISFLAGLIATGMGTNYSIAMGRCDQRRARQFFVQAFWTIMIAGGALAAACFFGRDAFLSFMGATPEVTVHARSYMAWTSPQAIINGLVMLLVSLSYADGDSRICTLSYVAIFIVNLSVAVLAVWLGAGTAGCVIGSLAANLVGIAILCLHFKRKSNTFAPVVHFSLRDTWAIMVSSFGDAAAFLCDGLLFFFLNKYVIVHFGSQWLPVVGVAVAVWGFLEFFNGIGVAIQPIVTVYYGENNTKSLRSVMNSAMGVAVVEGAAFMALFGLLPGLVVKLVGVSDPVLVQEACVAVRYMCFGFVALAFAGLFNSYYMFVERPVLAGVVTFACYLVMPVACVAACSLSGLHGVWLGMGIGPFAGAMLSTLFIAATAGWREYPLLLPRAREAKLHVFDLTLDERSIVDVAQRVGEVPGVPMQASLMTEEVLMAVRDRAAGHRVLGEVTLDLNDGIVLTLRDDGEIFDITDADAQISSLRSFLVASMMQCNAGRMNLVTTGFNRNVFRF